MGTFFKEKEREISDWFEKEVLPKEIRRKCFPEDWEDWTLEKVRFQMTERGVDHFASSPYFVAAEFANEKRADRRDFHLVVKFISQDPEFRAAMKTEGQFYNEASVYNVLLPAFEDYLKGKSEKVRGSVREICPFSYYAAHDFKSPEKSVVVLEDLRKRGYRTAESKVELDLDHCRIALRSLARFHALSLAMKMEAPEELNRLKNMFVENNWIDLPEQTEFGDKFMGVQNVRAIDYLLSKGEESEVPAGYLRKLREKVERNVMPLLVDLVTPKEPLALVCHGDFCRNNILFKYENGKPVNAKLFDFQTSRYAPVSHDLSFFFYMNTTLELREKHFDSLLRSYHSELMRTAAEILGVPETKPAEIFSYQKFAEEYAEHALYGYVIAAFFLPAMMVPEPDRDFEKEFMEMTVEEMAKDTFDKGGETVTKRIAEILIDFYRRNYCFSGIR